MHLKRLDGHWGSGGVPLLPESFRRAFSEERLPSWVIDDLGLSLNACVNALDETVWTSHSGSLNRRVKSYLVNLINKKKSELQRILAFARPWPSWLDPNKLPFSTRTQNCLLNGGLLADKDQLSTVTYGQLFAIPNMGTLSILEFICVSEAAIGQVDYSQEAVVAQSANTNEGAPHRHNEIEQFDKDGLAKVLFESWSDQVGSTDPRFSDLISSRFDGTIYQSIVNIMGGPDEDYRLLRPLFVSLPQIRTRISTIRAKPLEGQLADFLQAVSQADGSRLTALADRLGWNGTLPITLEEAGLRLGVTRERIRQLQERILNRMKVITFPVYMPALDDALSVLRASSPINVAEAAQLLKAKGVTDKEFHPACIISAAEICGRRPPICLQTVNERTIVTTTEFPNADAVLYTAYRQAQASGASNIAEVVAELKSKAIETDEPTASHVLRQLSDVQFLEGQWFCHRPKNSERDRLRNITRKMLSVAAPIELGEVREGVRREFRYRGYRGMKTWSLIVPPRSVLRGYYNDHPEFTIDSRDLVNCVNPLDYRKELSSNDAILVDALRSSPACILDRSSLWTACARRSMNNNTFSLYLSYSPVIIHLGTDIWSLRGVKVDPAAVEAVRNANALRPKEKRVLDHGWTPDGQLWMATRLPASNHGNRVFGIPGPIKRYLVGRQFAIKDDDGVSHGALRINDEGSSYGFAPFLRRRGADEGDILIAEFNLSSGEALLRLGNDEMLDEMSPES
jgi:Sigma-70, region 4